MSQVMERSGTSTAAPFVDRRGPPAFEGLPVCERRQFADAYDALSPEAAELAHAIDQYKVLHRRRFITQEELLGVFKSLGDHR